MTVNARNMLKRQVVLMVGKLFWTVWYADRGERGLTGKTQAWGDVCTQN